MGYFEQEIKDDCLNIINRLLFVLYAESRKDLDILPGNDPYKYTRCKKIAIMPRISIWGGNMKNHLEKTRKKCKFAQ